MTTLAATAPDPYLEWLSRAGSLGILAFAVLAFLRGWIVPGSRYEEAIKERDRALELVYKNAEIAQRAIEAAERRNP